MSELDQAFYKISELALLLKVSDDTIRRRIKHLELDVVRDGHQIVRIPRTQALRLANFIEKHQPKK